MDTIMEKRYYIAYGSNLNIAQMRVRCPQARIIGTSEIKDYELLFKGSQTGSYLTIEKKAGGIVPVAVWATTAADEVELDRYEGFPTFYYKAEMEKSETADAMFISCMRTDPLASQAATMSASALTGTEPLALMRKF